MKFINETFENLTNISSDIYFREFVFYKYILIICINLALIIINNKQYLKIVLFIH